MSDTQRGSSAAEKEVAMQSMNTGTGDTKKMLLIASTGGHLAQLVRLSPGLGASDDSLWVTFRTPQSESLLKGKRVQYVPYVRSRDVLGAAKAAMIIRGVLRRERFDLAVSTGAALAVSALPLARLAGVETLYIESVSRVEGPSLSGRIIAATRAAKLRTQHVGWASKRWILHPSVFSSYTAIDSIGTDTPSLFVTLGTIEGYRFDALLDQILASGLADERTVWQLGFTTDRHDLPGTVYQQVSAAEFSRHAQEADVVVTHAGVGSFMGLMELGIYPVLVTRSKSRGEHVDDHQHQIARLALTLGIASAVDAPDLTRDILIEASHHSIELDSSVRSLA
jgi:UDP-N-acetylglucosamine--N-acetylmuramyl-(pentapeptide) pyrophosphoryl-undecaprenol N-acetylglucosamine transferase